MLRVAWIDSLVSIVLPSNGSLFPSFFAFSEPLDLNNKSITDLSFLVFIFGSSVFMFESLSSCSSSS